MRVRGEARIGAQRGTMRRQTSRCEGSSSRPRPSVSKAEVGGGQWGSSDGRQMMGDEARMDGCRLGLEFGWCWGEGQSGEVVGWCLIGALLAERLSAVGQWAVALERAGGCLMV